MNIQKLARKNILKIQPYKPGKPISEVAEELGLKNIIKLASNESPLGPSDNAQRAIRKALRGISLYPEGSSIRLREGIAKKEGIRSGNIIVGNGSNEIIELILRAFLNEGEEVITGTPSFLVYALSVKISNGRLIEVPLDYYTFDLDAISKRITSKTKIIFICNPNNPTGTMVDKKAVDRFMKRIPRNVIVIFDEAYKEFSNSKMFPITIKYINRAIILRTFSKIYGLAGLRVGYGIGSIEIIQLLNKVRQPFNVNSLAQAGALAALKDNVYRFHMLNTVKEGKAYFYKEFYKLGLFYIPSQTNFVLVNVGDGDKIFRKLLKKGIIIRSMLEYKLPEFIRVTVGTAYQNRKFIEALKEVL